MAGHIKAVAFFEEMKDSVFGTILLRTVDENAEGFGGYFTRIGKSVGFQPRAYEWRLGDMATVDELTNPRDAASANEPHSATLL